jgi:lipopolysaccharide transport system permease protein
MDPGTAAQIIDTPPAAAGHPPGALSFEGEETLICRREGWIPVDWKELWHFRELLYFLVWRDLKVRYKQTLLGVGWAVLQPVCSMVIFTIIFGHLAKLDSDGFPYAVFVYAGLLPWTFFSASVALAGQSLVHQQGLMTKVYFPRLFVPTASVGASFVDLAISFGVYAVILAAYRVAPSWQIIFLPGLILFTALATLGLSYIFAALTVSYRDFRFLIPFMLQVMMYASPVVYSVHLFPQRYQWILALNPMAGIIDGYRSAILGKPWDWMNLGISSTVAAALFIFGIYYFRKTERGFADVA